MKKWIAAALLLLTGVAVYAQRRFVHPGVLHTQQRLEQMRSLLERQDELALGSFELLKNHPGSQPNYQPEGPFDTISRDGRYSYTKPMMERDFSAIYHNALMWGLTGRTEHAERSRTLLLAYAGTLKHIPDTNDAPLLVGLEGLKIIYATELLHHTYAGFSEADFGVVSEMLRRYFIPVMERFYARKAYTNGNWGPIVTKAYMAAAILWDDEAMYDRARAFYLHAEDNGTIEHYIDGETGQCQESGRDQGHVQLGLGALATVCEIAWQQGDDLYSALDNRLLTGFEYTARYNLGEEVPFRVWQDVTGKYSDWNRISEHSRGYFKPIFEMAYNHYVNRMGLAMPYTERVLSLTRPEGFERDQPSFGSLLFNENE